jgi:peptidoglycan/LPS O-acetylase OafA/YrhL
MTAPVLPARLHTLDAARGVAALAVVFWHWQNFWRDGGVQSASFRSDEQPLYELFRPLYTSGDTAVDLFFSLSGFVFFWLYGQRVHERSIGGPSFFWLRFSRLYPLHLATLLFVAVGQALYFSLAHKPFIYTHNDAWHFGLHLLLASSAGLESGHSFNAPVWSVSVEAVLYLLFFVFCRFIGLRLGAMLLLSLLGFFVLSRLYLPLGRGVGSFFAGGCVFLAYRAILHRPQARGIALAVFALVGVLWAATLLALYTGRSLEQVPLLKPLHWKFPVMVLFPLSILALALAESFRPQLGRGLAWLGDISYSSYLLHFPLQLAWGIAVPLLGLSSAIYRSPWTLALFFAMLLPLSLASYRWFERPMQDRLRRIGQA